MQLWDDGGTAGACQWYSVEENAWRFEFNYALTMTTIKVMVIENLWYYNCQTIHNNDVIKWSKMLYVSDKFLWLEIV